jgi:hypothetical protein
VVSGAVKDTCAGLERGKFRGLKAGDSVHRHVGDHNVFEALLFCGIQGEPFFGGKEQTELDEDSDKKRDHDEGVNLVKKEFF